MRMVAILVLCATPRVVTAQEPLPVTGREDPALEPFDRMMEGFVREHRVPGASLAVSRDGKLVYARGFGYADVEAKEPVRPGSLFRVASVSKPITAVAVLGLSEKGKLSLDDRVFDLLGLGEKIPAGAELDPRWRDVTVLELLRHTGGWDRDASFDPMFRSVEFAREAGVEPPADPWTVIRAMLGRRLDFDPGQRYAYSNFGYCLLGRVVEKVTGMPYERAVREEVLEPIGVVRARLGKTLPEGRAEGEVTYYGGPSEETGPSVFPPDVGREVPEPYGAWCLESMDAHGGWIASAADLVKFGSSVESMLSARSMEVMLSRPDGRAGHGRDGRPSEVYYGGGWQVRHLKGGGMNTWHTGSLPGTQALLVRRHDGLCWAVLMNSRATPKGRSLVSEIDPRVHEAADAVREWPSVDLFPELLGVAER